jgi:hypothetical protein
VGQPRGGLTNDPESFSGRFRIGVARPQAFCAEPQDVADYPQLSREEKLAILRRWEQDALRLSASETEGMGGGKENMLGRVEPAIQVVCNILARDRHHATQSGKINKP